MILSKLDITSWVELNKIVLQLSIFDAMNVDVCVSLVELVKGTIAIGQTA